MAFDTYLKIDGIKGESKDDKHKDEIDLHSHSWGVTNAGSMAIGGGGGTGKASVGDFHCTFQHCAASPKLLLACMTGDHIKSAVVTSRVQGGGQVEKVVIKLTDILVSSYQTGGGNNSDHIDQLSLNFSKIEWTYKEQKPDGSAGPSTMGNYDVKGNKKF